MSLSAEKGNEDLLSIKEKWSAPAGLQSSPLPRTVQITKQGRFNVFFPLVIIAIFTCVFGLLFWQAMQREQTIKALEDHGQPVRATLVSKRYFSGKGSHYEVVYGYRVGEQDFQNSSRVSRSFYDRVQVGTNLAAVFLPEAPKKSSLDGERVNAQGKFLFLLPFVSLLGLLSALKEINKQKRLLSDGSVAPAIVDQVTRGKSAYFIRYRFIDGFGTATKGRCTIQYAAAPEEGQVMTVLYMPDKPSVSRLYVSGYYELVKSVL